MRNIIAIMRMDAARIRHSTIALIVVVGLVIIPCLYAWFNIAGSWNPYGNTGNLKVAVANSDAGYKSDLIPIQVNLGDQVVSALRANDQLGWTFVDEDDAVEGVKSGRYYAAVVIPKDFSANMMTLFSQHAKHPELVYYENQKMNAIAPRVTETGSSTVQEQVNTTFAQAIGDVGLATSSSLLDYMSGDEITNYVANLSDTLGDGITSLRSASGSAASFGNLLGSTSSMIDSTGSLLADSGTTSSDASGMLDDAKSGLADVEGALKGATDAINDALRESSGTFDAVSNSVDAAIGAGSNQATLTAKQLRASAATIDKQIKANQDSLARLKDTALFPNQEVMKPLQTMLQTIIDKETALSAQLKATASELETGAATANKDLAAVKQALAEAKAGITSVKATYEDALKGKTRSLRDSISGISASASDISGRLDTTVESLSSATDSLARDLGGVQTQVSGAATELDASAAKLEDMKNQLDAAAQSGDVAKIRALIGSDPEGLAKALSAPVGVTRKPIYHIDNYGSAMAPFYTTVSLWVGGIVLAAMLLVQVRPSDQARLDNLRLYQIYLGRFGLFGALSLCQSTLMIMGNLLFFGIQCENPVQFILAGWVAGFVFCNIIYTFTVSFGDIGKALAVVLLVMQVGGSGGTFPIEMTAPFFQAVYPWLPAVHVINAMHAAMAGSYGMEYWIELAKIAAYLVPSLALGLVLRRPVVRANNWIIERLESTKLM